MTQEPLSLRDIQLRCLNMLRQVDAICASQGIRYFLSGGTLLGAVRHQGFIPWDDDIDTMMPRPDFERFLQVAPGLLGEGYRLAHPRVNEGYAMPWIRIWDLNTRMRPSRTQRIYTETLFLDIFPIDGIPSSPIRSKLYFRRVRALDIMLKCSRRKALFEDERLQVMKKALGVVSRVRSSAAWARSIDRLAARQGYEGSQYAGVSVITHYGERERMPKSVFTDCTMVRFEGATYPAPGDYDTYLTRLYGDYMTPPDRMNQHSDHNIRAYLVRGGEEQP